jgi:predicted kinase
MNGLNLRIGYVRPTFIMLVGIPGSGKSTYAEKLTNEFTKHISSDAIRKELYGDESCQDDHSRVFNLMHERTIEALKNGYDVVYDATNITRKSRLSILKQLPAYVEKKCVIVWAPISYCVSRDLRRGRHVGEEVIDKMLKRFEAPFYDEGFDSIFIYRTSNDFNQVDYLTTCMKAMDIPHDSPWHSADVREHCKLCAEYLQNKQVPEVVKFAGAIHDIGKPMTKTFSNTKGEPTDIAHYYGHQAVGAWISYGFANAGPTLAWLISTHMAPYINQKYYNSLDPFYKNWIDILHEADRAAH